MFLSLVTERILEMTMLLRFAPLGPALALLSLASLAWPAETDGPQAPVAELTQQLQGALSANAQTGAVSSEAFNQLLAQIAAAPQEEQPRLLAAAGLLLAYALMATAPPAAPNAEGDQATASVAAPPLEVALVNQEGRWQIDLAATFDALPLAVRKNAPLLFAALLKAVPPGAGAPGGAVPEGDFVVGINDENFGEKVLQAQGYVLVDFSATWCPPCQALKPIFHQVAARNHERLQFGTVDVDESEQAAERYRIQAVPTLILFRDGQPVARREGYMSEDLLQAWLDQNVR